MDTGEILPPESEFPESEVNSMSLQSISSSTSSLSYRISTSWVSHQRSEFLWSWLSRTCSSCLGLCPRLAYLRLAGLFELSRLAWRAVAKESYGFFCCCGRLSCTGPASWRGWSIWIDWLTGKIASRLDGSVSHFASSFERWLLAFPLSGFGGRFCCLGREKMLSCKSIPLELYYV